MVDVVSGPGRSIRIDAGRWTVDDVLDDAAIAAFRAWASDGVLSESLNRLPDDLSREDVVAIARHHGRRTGWLLFIRDTVGGGTVGYVSLAVDPTNGVATMEMIVGDPMSRGRGIIDSVASAGGDWLFTRQRVRKVSVHVRSDNRVTAGWLDRNAVLEGRLRGDIVLPNGRVVDRLIYGIMAHEWVDRNRVVSVASPSRDVSRREHAADARIGLRRRQTASPSRR